MVQIGLRQVEQNLVHIPVRAQADGVFFGQNPDQCTPKVLVLDGEETVQYSDTTSFHCKHFRFQTFKKIIVKLLSFLAGNQTAP